MAAIAPTFEEIQAESGPPAFEDIAPLSPDPDQQNQQIQTVLDLSKKHGIAPDKAQRRQTLINQLFSNDDYEEAVTSRQTEKANAGAAGFWMELIDAETRGAARVGAAFKRAHAALARWNPLWEPTSQEKAQLEVRAKRYEEQANLYWEVAKNPDLAGQDQGAANKAINLVGETLPYITATTAAYMVAGPLGGFAAGGLVEGHSIYQTAIDKGVDEQKAKWLGASAGIIIGAIESVGGKAAGEIFEKIVLKKIESKIAQGAALFGLGTLIEALEEGSQEAVTIGAEEFYRDVDWKERLTRIAASMAGGAFLGGTMRSMQIASKQLMQETKESPQLEENLTQAIKEITGLLEPEARKVAQDAITDKFHPEETEAVSAEKPTQVTPDKEVTTEIGETQIAQEGQTGTPAAGQSAAGAVQGTAAAEQAGKPTLETSADKTVIFEGELFHGTDEVAAAQLLGGKPFKISTTSGGGEIEGADFGNGAYFVLRSGLTGPYGEIELKAKTTKPLRLYEATTIEEKGFVSKNWRELAKQGFDGAVFRQGGITEGTEYENEVVLFNPKGKVETLYDTGQTDDENAYQAQQSFIKAPPAPVSTPSAVQPVITPVSEAKTQAEKAEVAEQAPEGPKGPPPAKVEMAIAEPELPSILSAKNADIDEQRKKLGLDVIASPTRKADQQVKAEAIKQGIPEKALRIAADIVSGRKETLSDVEEAGMTMKLLRLDEEMNPILLKLAATDDVGEIEVLRGEMAHMKAEYDTVSEALHKGTTEVARALRWRQVQIKLEQNTYTLLYARAQMKAQKGNALTAKEEAALEEVTKKLATSEEQIKTLQKQIEDMTARQAIRDRGAKKYTRMSLEQKDTQLQKNAARIEELMAQGCY